MPSTVPSVVFDFNWSLIKDAFLRLFLAKKGPNVGWAWEEL